MRATCLECGNEKEFKAKVYVQDTGIIELVNDEYILVDSYCEVNDFFVDKIIECRACGSHQLVIIN